MMLIEWCFIDGGLGSWINSAVLGIKYKINGHAINFKALNIINKNIYYLKEIYNNEYEIYETDYIFPFGYYLNNTVNMDNDSIEIQNEILQNYGYKDNNQYVYKETEFTSEFINYKKDIEEIKDGDFEKIKINYIINANKNISIECFSKINVEIDTASDFVFVEGKRILTEVSSLKKEENIEFSIICYKEDYKEDSIIIYIIDDDKAKEKILDNNINTFTVEEINKNKMTGTANFEEDGFLCFQIVFDNGWNVFVDGKKVDSKKIYDSMLGVKLSKGTHKVEISYEQPYLREGSIISIISLMILLIVIIMKKEKR